MGSQCFLVRGWGVIACRAGVILGLLAFELDTEGCIFLCFGAISALYILDEWHEGHDFWCMGVGLLPVA